MSYDPLRLSPRFHDPARRLRRTHTCPRHEHHTLHFPLRGLLSATGAGSRGSPWMEPRDRSRGRRGPARHRTRTRAIYGAPVHILHGLLSATGGEWEWGDSQRSLLSLRSLYHAAWAFVRRVSGRVVKSVVTKCACCVCVCVRVCVACVFALLVRAWGEEVCVLRVRACLLRVCSRCVGVW